MLTCNTSSSPWAGLSSIYTVSSMQQSSRYKSNHQSSACFFGMKKVQTPEEIMQGMAFAGKVCPSPGTSKASVITDPLPGWIHLHSPLGPFRFFYPLFYHLPLHPHLLKAAIPHDLLLGTPDQLHLLLRFSPRRLSHLPTNLGPMGSLDPRWRVPTRKEHGLINLNLEPCPRRCGGGDAHANPLASQDECRQEGCRE